MGANIGDRVLFRVANDIKEKTIITEGIVKGKSLKDNIYRYTIETDNKDLYLYIPSKDILSILDKKRGDNNE